MQVIEYKTLITIYCFIPGLEKKLKICLRPYEDIVLQEVNNLLDTKYKEEEKKYLEEYQRMQIYGVQISLKREDITKKAIIFGNIPEDCIICGWTISTKVNSKPYDIICSWEKNKELGY